jgi:membrane protein DedA with SNARE-associated domain
LRLLVAALGSFFVAAMIGTALAPTLVVTEPLLLIALNPVLRHLVLVANQLEPAAYFVVGALRLFGPDPFHYLLGRWYGDSALVWLERKSPRAGRVVRAVETAFARAGLVILFVAPEGIICLLAGAARVRPLTFIALDVAGTFTMLALVRSFGRRYEQGIQGVLDFVEGNILVLTAASVVLVVASAVWRRRRSTRREPASPGSGSARERDAGADGGTDHDG